LAHIDSFPARSGWSILFPPAINPLSIVPQAEPHARGFLSNPCRRDLINPTSSPFLRLRPLPERAPRHSICSALLTFAPPGERDRRGPLSFSSSGLFRYRPSFQLFFAARPDWPHLRSPGRFWSPALICPSIVLQQIGPSSLHLACPFRDSLSLQCSAFFPLDPPSLLPEPF